ncbi:MAG: biliverdin-producing heme oxygenase [Azospirillaceae bacterium]|nr:biliverdin-producing heme oxygenase [Azospirillaceae bacterium]
MTELRVALRTATAACHAELDGLFSNLDMGRAPDYAAFLKAQHPALRAVELSLEAAGVEALLPDWPQRRRRHALERDLADLDAAARISTVMVEAPTITGRAEMLGHLYVIEGSRLGGEVLLRRVLAANDPRLAVATRFLAHGRGRRLWQGFLTVLEAPQADEVFRTRLIGSAVAAFGLFQKAAEQVIAHYGASHHSRQVSRS